MIRSFMIPPVGICAGATLVPPEGIPQGVVTVVRRPPFDGRGAAEPVVIRDAKPSELSPRLLQIEADDHPPQ